MARMTVNGIALNVEVSGSGPALTLLHGFTRDVREWEPVLPAWPGFQLVRIDLIGHGRSDSPPDASRYTMAHAADDLAAVLDGLGIGRTALLGYSLGGRVALHFALAHQQRLWALVLESASPGIADPAERAARRQGDAELAESIVRDGLEAFVDRWQAQPLFASQSRLPAAVLAEERRRRLENSPLGLANSLRGMGAGVQDYLLPRLRELRVPTLFVAGALDGRYAALARSMAEVAGADHRIIEGAGHTTHLERPAEFAAVVGEFLGQHAPKFEQEGLVRR